MSSEDLNRVRTSQTIGTRLTLWGASITFGVCLLVSVALYGGVWYSLNREVDSFLEGEVREFLGVVQEHRFDFAEAQQLIRLHLGSRTKVDLTFRILDDQGNALLTSHTHDLIPKAYVAVPLQSHSSSVAFDTLSIPGQRHPLRVCSVPVQGPGSRRLLAQASYTLDQVSASLAMLRVVSGGCLLAAVVLSLLGGRVLARRSLGPLHQMVQTARQITTHRIAQRLPRSRNGDEFDLLAETLNGMLDRNDKYVRRMQQFTADASHELRSPLAALQGSAELALTRDRPAEELRDVIESSIEQYRRLRKISDDLLLLAQIDSGEDILDREPTRLDALIEDVIDFYEPTATEAGLHLGFVRQGPVAVVGDGGRLRQVVANLVDNALKYSTVPGQIVVSLAEENGCAIIEVRDTGVGISAEDLPYVFERFFRTDRARTQSGATGAGLGLAICRSIVAAHDGSLTIGSEPGAGTFVRVELPTAT